MIRLIACILGLASITAHARLGENPEQCDQRYGEPTVKNKSGDLEFRSYRFSGNKIRVIFHQSESVFEAIVNGPNSFISSTQAEKMTGESLSFFRGLLTSVYQFTDDQLKNLDLIKQDSRESASSFAVNGQIRATHTIESDPTETSLKFTCSIANLKIQAIAEEVGKFMGEGVRLELKNAEKQKASGF